MQDFRKLLVWRNSLDFAIEIYKATDLLPPYERYGLRSQMRSAAVSVSSNIAEGCGRPTRGDMARFLGMAIGSVCEVECQLYIVRRLSFLDDGLVDELLSQLSTVKRRLNALYERVSAARTPITDPMVDAPGQTHPSASRT